MRRRPSAPGPSSVAVLLAVSRACALPPEALDVLRVPACKRLLCPWFGQEDTACESRWCLPSEVLGAAFTGAAWSQGDAVQQLHGGCAGHAAAAPGRARPAPVPVRLLALCTSWRSRVPPRVQSRWKCACVYHAARPSSRLVCTLPCPLLSSSCAPCDGAWLCLSVARPGPAPSTRVCCRVYIRVSQLPTLLIHHPAACSCVELPC